MSVFLDFVVIAKLIRKKGIGLLRVNSRNDEMFFCFFYVHYVPLTVGCHAEERSISAVNYIRSFLRQDDRRFATTMCFTQSRYSTFIK